MTVITPDLYWREVGGGLRSVNSSILRPGPPQIVDDGFVLYETEPTEFTSRPRPGLGLDVINGDVTITSTDQLPFIGKDVRGAFQCRVPNALMEDVIVRGPVTGNRAAVNFTAAAAGWRMNRVAVIPQTPSIFQDGFRLESRGQAFRVGARDVVDCFRILADDIDILGSWGGKFYYNTPVPDGYQNTDRQPHNDWVQFEKGLRARLLGNTADGYYGTAGQTPANTGGPTPSGWPNPSFAWVMMTPNVGPVGQHQIIKNWVYGFDVPFNVGSGGMAGADLGDILENLFDGKSRVAGGVLGGATLYKRADQTANFGVGTARRNRYMDGRDVTIRSA